MTEETTLQTFDAWGDVDYTGILEDIRSEVQAQTEILETMQEVQATQSSYIETYIPELFKVSCLILGSFIAVTLFRWLISFLGRVFNDKTKF